MDVPGHAFHSCGSPARGTAASLALEALDRRGPWYVAVASLARDSVKPRCRGDRGPVLVTVEYRPV